MKEVPEIIEFEEDLVDDDAFSFSKEDSFSSPPEQTAEGEDEENEEKSDPCEKKIEIPSEFKPCKNKDDIPMQELCLLTGAVTERLSAIGVTHRNTVIRYTSAFYDLLTVKKDLTNDRYLYTEESVRQLAFIINDVKNSGRSFKQELEYLRSHDGAKVMAVASDNVNVFEKMFTQMQNNIIQANTAQIQEMYQALLSHLDENNAALLEDKRTAQIEEKMQHHEEILLSIVEQKDAEIRELKEQLEQAKKKKPFWKR